MSNFNIYGNPFVGWISESVSAFPISSFVRNDDLYGCPLPKNCSDKPVKKEPLPVSTESNQRKQKQKQSTNIVLVMIILSNVTAIFLVVITAYQYCSYRRIFLVLIATNQYCSYWRRQEKPKEELQAETTGAMGGILGGREGAPGQGPAPCFGRDAGEGKHGDDVQGDAGGQPESSGRQEGECNNPAQSAN